MWLSTHYFSGLLQDWFHVFLYEIKKKFSVVQFLSRHFSVYNFLYFWALSTLMMDSKAQRVFFPKTPKLCVWHTEVRSCYHFKLVSHFQLWFPIWGVLVNRLKKKIQLALNLHCLRKTHVSLLYIITLNLSFRPVLRHIIQLNSRASLFVIKLASVPGHHVLTMHSYWV